MDSKYLASVLSFLSIFLAISAFELVPNYDNVAHKMKFYEFGQPLVLSCNVTQDYKLNWFVNDTNVLELDTLKNRVELIQAEGKLIIKKTNLYDGGYYKCEANKQSAVIQVVVNAIVRLPSNTAVVEGEKLTITCATFNTNPTISWLIGNVEYTNSTDRIELKPDPSNSVQNAILEIENVSLEDRGEYKCIGRNAATLYGGYSEASDVSYVRVKGKLAALWPFLGICAEVLILCAIILVYEKRRNKSELEESDTDPQEQ